MLSNLFITTGKAGPHQVGERLMGLIMFFSLAPRVGVARWLAWFAVTIGIASLCVRLLTEVEGAALVIVYAVLGVFVAKLAAESSRRLHDCGQSARLGLAVAAGVLALILTGILRWLGHGADAVFWGAEGLAALAVAALLLRPGSPGVNAYGSPPAGPFAVSDAKADRIGVLVAAGCLVGGVGFGLAVLDWQAGIDRDRELRTRQSEGPIAQPQVSTAEGSVPANDVDAAPDDESAALLNEIDVMLNRGEAQ